MEKAVSGNGVNVQGLVMYCWQGLLYNRVLGSVRRWKDWEVCWMAVYGAKWWQMYETFIVYG